MAKREAWVFIVDVGASIQEGIARIVGSLKKRGIRVERLSTVPDVASRLSAAGTMSPEERPSAILNFHHSGIGIQDVHAFLSVVNQVGIPIINRFRASEDCSDRLVLKTRLRSDSVQVPDFFCGRPQDIPSELGDQVVLKGKRDHLVVVIDRTRSRSCGEMVYVERLLQNPHPPFVRCVYIVGDYAFTATKIDDFVNFQLHPMLEEKKGIVSDNPAEVEVAKRIAKKLRLNLCSIEFIGEFVIDVNECPDFTFHEDAIDAFVAFVDNFIHRGVDMGVARKKGKKKR